MFTHCELINEYFTILYNNIYIFSYFSVYSLKKIKNKKNNEKCYNIIIIYTIILYLQLQNMQENSSNDVL